VAGTATPPRSAALKTYRATDNGNGTVSIHDVEFVSPLEAGHRYDAVGKAPEIGRSWMERVVATHLEQLVGGYVAPVHAEHKGPGGSGDLALGTFVPLTVRVQRYEGEDVPMVVGDLTVDMATLAAIRRGEYPYRSIEVERWEFGLINSLALMTSSAPYSRVPMLRNVVVDGEVAADPTLTATALAPVALATKRSAGFLDAPARLRAEALARLETYAEMENADDGAADEGREGEGDDADCGKKPFAKRGGAGESADTGDAAGGSKLLGAMMTLLARIAEKVLGSEAGDPRPDPARDEHPENSGEADPEAALEADKSDENDADDESDEKKKETAKMSATPPTPATLAASFATLEAKFATLSAENATLKTENATLKSRLDTADATAKARDRVAAARAQLRAEKVILAPNFDAEMTKLALLPDATIFDGQVAMLKASGAKDPPEHFSDEVFQGAGAADDALVMAYAGQGAAKLEAARKVQSEFRALKARVPGTPTTLAEMLTIRMNPKATA